MAILDSSANMIIFSSSSVKHTIHKKSLLLVEVTVAYRFVFHSSGVDSANHSEKSAENHPDALGSQNKPILRSIDAVAKDLPSHILSTVPDDIKLQLQTTDERHYNWLMEQSRRHSQYEQRSPVIPASGVNSVQAGSNSPNGNGESAQNGAHAFGATDPMGGPNQPVLREVPARYSAKPPYVKLQLQTMTEANFKHVMEQCKHLEAEQARTINGVPGTRTGLVQPQMANQPANGSTHLQPGLNSSNGNGKSAHGFDPRGGGPGLPNSRMLPEAAMPGRQPSLGQPQMIGRHRQTGLTPLDAQAIIAKKCELHKALTESTPVSTCLGILNELRSGVVPSEKLLRETEIGMAVDYLRWRASHPDVLKLITEIVNGWRVAIESGPGPHPSNAEIFGPAWSKSTDDYVLVPQRDGTRGTLIPKSSIGNRKEPETNEDKKRKREEALVTERHRRENAKIAASKRSFEAFMSRPAWMDAKLGKHLYRE